MNTTINPTSYPFFVPDQVLTADDLNGLVNYLEGLNQLTRTHFIGMGIVQGLEVQTLEQKTKIHITPGCGVTSRGFVIKIPAQTETGTGLIFTHSQRQTIPKNVFIPNESSEQSYAVSELISVASEGQQTEDNTIQLLKKEELQDKVIIVLYNWQDVPRADTCLLSYDDRGQDRNFRLRFFLLPQKEPSPSQPSVLSAEHLLRAGYPIEQMPEAWRADATTDITTVFEARNRFFKAFNPQVRRFGYVDSTSIDLTKISDYKAFRDNYFEICNQAIDTISNAFSNLFKIFSPIFTSFHPNSQQDFNELAPALRDFLKRFNPENRQGVLPENTEHPSALQYFYDYLSQLNAAFIELAEAAFDLMDDCTPEMSRFPQFLMLGLIPSLEKSEEDYVYKVYEVPSAYRNQFIQPRIYNSNQELIQKVRNLYERLLKLCSLKQGEESFYLLPFYNTPIKITPGKDRSAPLSEQAIPYYLNYPKLYLYWNYDAYRKGRSDSHPAYFYPKQGSTDSGHIFDELTYRLDAYNFYRIEGHIGKSNTDAFKGIQDYQQRYNLPFDIITLKLGNLDSLSDLNISAQVADLNADFGRIQERFQTLWELNAERWSNNALLNTLKQIFFDQPGLAKINSDLILSPFLDRAKISESYEFVPELGANDQPTNKYRLFLKNRSGTQIAQYIFHISRDENRQDFEWLNFTGLTDDKIAQEKTRIIAGLVDALTLDKVTYRLEPQDSIVANLVSFHLRLSSQDKLNVQLDQSQGSSQQEVTIELRSLNPFSISLKSDLPQINEAGCPDVLTLYGLLRDVPEDFASTHQFKFELGDKGAAKVLGAFELRGLVEAYEQRLQRLISLHFFHLFAKQHPGMEPVGGVSKGGTFVLVYVDGRDLEPLLADEHNQAIHAIRDSRTKTIQTEAWLPPSSPDEPPGQELRVPWELLQQEVKNRKDIVVADFCLPYRSGSDAPSISYVLARPRPIVLLQKAVFCEGDSKEYPFILEPEGGTVKGEGVVFKENQHLFQPSSINQSSKNELAKGNEIAITFSYAVDDTYDTLTVTIYPLPRPNLTIQEGQRFCQDAPPVEIGLAPGTPETVELGLVTVNGAETKTLVPSQYAANEQPETVKIEAHLRDRQSDCTNTLTRTVTINPLPKANLSISEGQNFCHDAAAVEITIAPDAPADVELVQVTINGTETKTLVPNQYATKGQPQTVAIATRIRNKQTQCESTITRTVTINPLPEANLSIQEGQNFCQDASPIEITLAPGTPEEVELVRVTVNGRETKTLVPNQYATEGQPQTITIAARIRNKQTQCESTLTHTVTINPLPEAALSLREGQSFCYNDPPVEIRLAPGTPKDVELAQVTVNGTVTTTLDPGQYAKTGQSETVVIAVRIRNRQTRCENTVTRTVTINPLPDASFQVGDETDQTTFSTTDPPIHLNPNQSGGTFQAWIGEQDISDTVLQSTQQGIQFVPHAVRLDEGESEKSITLKYIVTSDKGCRNELPKILTIFAPPSIERLDLLTLSPGGDTINRTTLQNGQTFPRSYFTETYKFEAVAVGRVNGITFTYTAPGTRPTPRPVVNQAPYIMPDPPWQPLIGRHQIQAQAFTDVEGRRRQGEALTIALNITDDTINLIDPNRVNPENPPQPDSPQDSAPQAPPTDLTDANPVNPGNPPAQPDSPESAAPPGVNPSVVFEPQESARRFNLSEVAASHQSSSETQPVPGRVDKVLFPHKAPSSNGNSLSLAQADTSHASKDLPVTEAQPRMTPTNSVNSSEEQPPFLQHLKRRLSNGLKTKLTQVLALSAIAALLILGWNYSVSIRAGKPSYTNRLDKIPNSAK